MADELNIPTHRWYQKRNHIALAKDDFSRKFIYDSGIQKIDAFIALQPWGNQTSIYAILGLEPPLVLDFDETYYRTGGTATDLVSAATHTRAGNDTMVDSDGVLKWAPHNLVLHSEDFSNPAWIKLNCTATAGSITEDTSTSFHGLRPEALTATINTFEVEAKEDSGRYVIVTLGEGDTQLLGGGVVVDLQTGSILTACLLYTSPSPRD